MCGINGIMWEDEEAVARMNRAPRSRRDRGARLAGSDVRT